MASGRCDGHRPRHGQRRPEGHPDGHRRRACRGFEPSRRRGQRSNSGSLTRVQPPAVSLERACSDSREHHECRAFFDTGISVHPAASACATAIGTGFVARFEAHVLVMSARGRRRRFIGLSASVLWRWPRRAPASGTSPTCDLRVMRRASRGLVSCDWLDFDVVVSARSRQIT